MSLNTLGRKWCLPAAVTADCNVIWSCSGCLLVKFWECAGMENGDPVMSLDSLSQLLITVTEKNFPHDQLKTYFLQTVITTHCPLTVHLSDEARFVFSTTPFYLALTRWLKRVIRVFLFSPHFPYPLKGHMLQLLTILLASLWTHSQNWRLLQMQPHKCQADVNHHFLWPTFDTFISLQELTADSNLLLSY